MSGYRSCRFTMRWAAGGSESANNFTPSAHAMCGDAQQCSQFPNFVADMADADSAVVRGSVGIPFVDETARADGKAVTTVRIADFKYGAGHGLCFGEQQLQATVCRLDNREEGDGPMPHRHFDGEAAAHLTVKHRQRANLCLA